MRRLVEPGLYREAGAGRDARPDSRGRPPRPDRQQPATGGVYAGDRSRKTARDQRVYRRRIRFDSQKTRKSAAEAGAETDCAAAIRLRAAF